MSGRRYRNAIIIACLVAAAIVAAAVPLTREVHARRLRSLFEGPVETPSESPRGFYPGIDYDLSGWLAPSGEPLAPEPAKADRAPAMGDLMTKPAETSPWEEAPGTVDPHAEWKVDAMTGATKVSRLRSPSVWREPWPHRALTITSPSDNALFPPNLCAPFVTWEDSENNRWRVVLSLDGREIWSAMSDARRVRIADGAWEAVVTAGSSAALRIEVRGIKLFHGWWKARETVHAARPVSFRVSKDPADDFIVYRLVEPPFINRKTPNTFVRDVRQLAARPFLLGRRQYCFNCHTFSSKSGDTGRVGIQVRYTGPEDAMNRNYVAIYDFDRRAGYRAILPFDVQMSTFMSWSPDGTKLVTSANQQITAFNPVVHETQSVGQPASDLAVFDSATGKVCLVPGASDPDTLEIYPSWTPDGKAIVYSSAPAGRHPSATKFDLRVVPYNDGRGGEPRDVAGAAKNGRSNFYARFSPDGKWMSFVEADSDSLIKPSSDIYLLPAEAALAGRARAPHRLESNAAGAADSWHSWSSNSRWLVFATKRDDGIYTRLYLTHIDDDGHASPAVPLPVDDPGLRSCYNIPEFVAHAPAVSEPALFGSVGIKGETFRVKPCGNTDNAGGVD